MSTRSILAVVDPEHDWKGVYHHSDGYPTGMGVYITRVLNALNWDIAQYRHHVIDSHPIGWSQLGVACFCHTRREQGPESYFYGDEYPDGKIDTDTEWLYIATPEGIIVHEIEWQEGHDFAKIIGPAMSMTEAVKCYAEKHVSEAYKERVLAAFANRDEWSFIAELPDFCLQSSQACAVQPRLF